MQFFTTNTPHSDKLDRFYIQSTSVDKVRMYSVVPNKKSDKVSWKYKRSAIKAFIRTICNNGWFGYVDFTKLDYTKPYSIEVQLVDKNTKEILCKARLHNDEKHWYLPRYSIIPIDPIAKEYYKS